MHEVSENNRLIVRIWTSENNTNYPGHNVGHVSLETQHPECYISLWPSPFTQEQIDRYREAGELERNYLRYFMERDAHYMQNVGEDIAAEGHHEPEITICLYGLNIEGLLERFESKRENTGNWCLIGGNAFVESVRQFTGKIFNQPSNQVENCASMAYRLLIAGNLYNEVSSSYSSNNSSVTRPDSLSELVIAAKRYELENYPETANFQFEGETELASEPDKGCVLL